jgi:hypothetical protein
MADEGALLWRRPKTYVAQGRQIQTNGAEAIPECASLTPVMRSFCGAFRDCGWHTCFFGEVLLGITATALRHAPHLASPPMADAARTGYWSV